MVPYGVQLSQGYRATKRRQFTCHMPVYAPGVPGTHFINLERMKDLFDLGVSQLSGFEHSTPGLEIQCLKH